MSDARCATPHQRLQPITRRPNSQVPTGLHSGAGHGNERRRETLFRIVGSTTSLDSGRTERKSEVERGPNADLAFYSDFPPMGIHDIFDNLSAQASATCFAADG